MQIDTQKTIEKTFEKYNWNDLENWSKVGSILTRPIYQDDNLVIYQQVSEDNKQVVFETAECTMRVSTGLHRDLTQRVSKKQVPYYVLSLETAISERNIYRSLIDDVGYQDIRGDRQHILNFERTLPKKYFSLEKNERGPYISTCWMRTGYRQISPRLKFSNKEKS